ncbi:MAG TPA: hypothetical protein VMO17_02845 [Terriglobia bacterium]|nr:hypothetical protein [Terriglobia bacterium]
MLATHVRQTASVLLESAIRIAPPDTRDWGRAIRGEMDQVDGSWAAALWAFGGTSVMVKEALVSLVVPGRRTQSMVPDGGLFAKSASLRKGALLVSGACMLVALLFFAAPPFRQAFRVAMRPWSFMYQASSGNLQPGIEALARRAEAQHDPAGMAFCAVRMRDAKESARLAEEAVRLDPHLLWVYAILALRDPGLPEVGRWVEKLKAWDPQNGLLPLITAESIVRGRLPRGDWSPPKPEQERAWRAAMTAAFQAPRIDDYLDRFAELNRKVVPRYRFYDPYEVESRWEAGLPDATAESCERFAMLLLRSGKEFEARGDFVGARREYWTVARFGQMIDAQAHTDFEHRNGAYLQSLAYQPLKALAEKEGRSEEAALLGYLAEKFNPLKGANGNLAGGSAFGHFTSHRNAAVVEVAGLMILVFSGLAGVALSILIAGSVRGAWLAAQRAKPLATLVALASTVGLLFSSVTLYLTYRPYWYIFQSAIRNGDLDQARDLHEFLISTQMLPGLSPHFSRTLLEALIYSGSPSFLFYVWAGVTLLGVSGLALILLRRFRGRPHASPP